MAISITLGGVDRTANSQFESLQVVNTITANADEATLRMVLDQSSTWRPLAGNEIVIDNGGTREFAGMVMEVVEQGLAGWQRRYVLHCKDYLYLFNKKLVTDDSTSLVGSSEPTADAVVRAIVAGSTDGFSSTGVAPGPLVPGQRFDYVTRGDAVRLMADMANYGWWIDYNKVINFVPSVSMNAPVTSINLDSDITNYGGMELTETVAQVKNRIIVKDWKQKSSISFNRGFTGDGATKFFLFGYEPSAIGDISATLNGVGLSVGTDQVDASPGDGVGTSGDVYVCFDNLGFRFGNYAPSSTETFSISAPYMTQGITQVEDPVAQSTAAMREGGDGIHEFVVADPGLTAIDGSANLADARGRVILERDAYAALSGRFSSYTQGWRAGQYFTLDSSVRMIGSLPRTVYVQQVTKRLVGSTGGAPRLAYQVDFSDRALAQ